LRKGDSFSFVTELFSPFGIELPSRLELDARGLQVGSKRQLRSPREIGFFSQKNKIIPASGVLFAAEGLGLFRKKVPVRFSPLLLGQLSKSDTWSVTVLVD
jgi:hypothetical protein